MARFPGSRSSACWWGSAAIVSILALTVATSAATADDFTPGNAGTPVISNLSPGFAMQPQLDGTSATYSISVDIADVDTLADLDTVKICLFLTGVGDSGCNDVNQDPQTTVSLTWTEVTNSFAIDATSGGPDDSHFSVQNSTSTYVPTNTSMTINFGFKVSEAMRAGDWTAQVYAEDGSGTIDTEVDPAYSVLHWAAVESGPGLFRDSQNFGEILIGGHKDKTAAATVVANGGTDILYQSEQFTGTVSSTVAGFTANPVNVLPDYTEAALDCSPGASYDSGAGVRLNGSAQDVETGVFASGTAEGGSAEEFQTCRLYNGGRLPIELYFATVTVSVTIAS